VRGERGESRVALVVGGSGALGGAVCRALAGDGFAVGVHYTGGADRAEAVRRDCAAHGVAATTGAADIGSWTEVEKLAGAVTERLGPIGVLVNAGAVRQDGLLATQPRHEWERTVEVNLLGVFHTCRQVLPTMITRRWGRIVNVVSPLAFTGNAGQTAYAAAKAGVVALTRSLALECGRRGVTANAVSPGFMDSALVAELGDDARSGLIARTAIRRPVEPAEVADAVRLVVGNAALTGAVIPVDGGLQ
jgi:3-oxoacyl-[acyl-carrier protein] reductase